MEKVGDLQFLKSADNLFYGKYMKNDRLAKSPIIIYMENIKKADNLFYGKNKKVPIIKIMEKYGK